MKPKTITSRISLLIFGAIVLAVVLVACGGGTPDTQNGTSADMKIQAATSTNTGPTLSWNPTSITDTAAPGTQQTIRVSFTASANMANVVIAVVPALQGLIQVSPSSLASVQKGQPVALTLAIAPSASAPLAVTQGTIQLRVGNPVIALPLPFQIIVASGAVGLLPPDPGAAGMVTLAGIDSDNDGVRDDIERYIWLTYPQSAKQRAALTAIAKDFQTGLLAASNNDANTTFQWNRKTADAIDCLWYVRGLEASNVRRALFSEFTNTKLRSVTYVMYNRLLAGKSFPGRKPGDFKAGCSGFDPDTMPN